jgi:hypothetical protein
MSRDGLRNPRVGPGLTPTGAGDNHSSMKSLLSVLALSAALGLAAGCGPQEAFCPNTSDAGGVCPIFGDDAMAPVQDMGGGPMGCPAGYQLETNPDGNSGLVCVKV